MSDEDEIGYFEAYDRVLMPLFTATSTVELVARAESSGLMTALRTASGVAELSVATDTPPSTTETLCRALAATGVARFTDGRYRLTPAWLALTGSGGYVPLADQLAGQRVELLMMRGVTYWELSSGDRVAYARSVAPDPFSDELVARLRDDPTLAPLAAGGRYLELGCGVAGRMLSILRGFPDLVGVGVEMSADLADEARRRADALGLSRRFQVVCGDATEYVADEQFDFGFWSQFFFPEASRAGALRTLFASVRSGGIVWAPVFGDQDRMAAEPDGDLAREYAVARVVQDAWGIPERNPDQLKAEMAAAGFVDTEIVMRPGGLPAVRATRP